MNCAHLDVDVLCVTIMLGIANDVESTLVVDVELQATLLTEELSVKLLNSEHFLGRERCCDYLNLCRWLRSELLFAINCPPVTFSNKPY